LRPQRYTKEFVDNSDLLPVSSYPSEYKKALELLGTKSGRDCDKVAESGLTPLFIGGSVAFDQAHTIFICKKLFGGQQLDASKFVDSGLDPTMYPEKDYHYFYYGGIETVYQCDK